MGLGFCLYKTRALSDIPPSSGLRPASLARWLRLPGLERTHPASQPWAPRRRLPMSPACGHITQVALPLAVS